MTIQPIVTFRHMDTMEAVDQQARMRAEALADTFPRIGGCEIVIEAPSQKHRKGGGHSVSVHVRLPGNDVHVSEQVAQGDALQDISLALHRAFDEAERAVRKQFDKMHFADSRPHAEQAHGVVESLAEGGDYGFIMGLDGTQYYFGRDSMTAGDWSSLKPGTKMRFKPMDGDKGPYAVAVSPA